MENKNRTIHCLRVGSLETNCWIYTANSGNSPQQFCAVIDPGSEGPLIIDYLKKNNLCPQYILLTHGHFDHVTALPPLKKAFPDSVTVIHADDAPYLKTAAGLLAGEGESIGPFIVLHLPGHTPGSIAFLDKEAGVLFSGDTLFYGTYGRTDLEGGSQVKMEESLRRLFAMDGGVRVLPGHGPETTIGQEAARQFL